MPIDLFEAFKATRQNDVPTLREALKTHDVNSTDDLGRTFLHHASVALAEDAVDFLLVEAEINPNIEDNNGLCAGTLLCETWERPRVTGPDGKHILSAQDRLFFSIANKLIDHESPFTADSELGDWPRDPSTGMAMSPYKLRKLHPGFLESVDGEDAEAMQPPPTSGHGVPSPK